MLSLAASTRIFVAAGHTDMRKGFDGLCGLVTSILDMDPQSGQLFLFINRRRDKMKILYWDGDGLAIWYRRLEQGTNQLPKIHEGQVSVESAPLTGRVIPSSASSPTTAYSSNRSLLN